PLGTSSSHSPAWTRLLLTGTLLTFSTWSASSELLSSVSLDPLTEGANAHLPVPRSLDRVLATSWFRGHELVTFPGNRQGILRSELNYSVILQWAALITPEPVLRWTFNGRPRGTGERLIIHRLSMKDLGTYLCLAKNSERVYLSQPVTIMLPQADVEPTEPAPISQKPPLSLSGGSAIALIVAASVAGLVLVGSMLFTFIQKLR
ncbi:hypothetical protein M91_05698, partial [Bos mutus]